MDAVLAIVPIALLVIVCDLPWLYGSSGWSQAMLKRIQGGAPVTFRWEGAPIVYIALAYLVLQARSDAQAFLIGLSTYAVYDFTNYSVLANYDPMFAVADTLWGGILFTIVRRLGLALNLL